MFGILEKMTIFAVVSCNNIIMAKENIIERINSRVVIEYLLNSKKMLMGIITEEQFNKLQEKLK